MITPDALKLLWPIASFAIFALLEWRFPARARELGLVRFGRHFGLTLVSQILSRLALGVGLVGVAGWAQGHGLGFFNIVQLPEILAVILCVFLLDFAIWAQHLAMHHVPILWRLHRVHHCDTIMDVSTALRFHPFEILVSLGFKVALVVALGAPPVAVVAFELILGLGALFSHANLALPNWLERSARWVIVTPALHLIHHSPNRPETNSNFGFSTTLWDRLCGTYRDAHISDDQRIGLENWRDRDDQTLRALLGNPLRR